MESARDIYSEMKWDQFLDFEGSWYFHICWAFCWFHLPCRETNQYFCLSSMISLIKFHPNSSYKALLSVADCPTLCVFPKVLQVNFIVHQKPELCLPNSIFLPQTHGYQSTVGIFYQSVVLFVMLMGRNPLSCVLNSSCAGCVWLMLPLTWLDEE